MRSAGRLAQACPRSGSKAPMQQPPRRRPAVGFHSAPAGATAPSLAAPSHWRGAALARPWRPARKLLGGGLGVCERLGTASSHTSSLLRFLPTQFHTSSDFHAPAGGHPHCHTPCLLAPCKAVLGQRRHGDASPTPPHPTPLNHPQSCSCATLAQRCVLHTTTPHYS